MRARIQVRPFILLTCRATRRRRYAQKSISAFLARPRQVTNTLAPPEGETSNDLFVAHDPLAVAYAIFNDPSLSPTSGSRAGWKTTLRKFRMETDGKLTRGMCVVE